MATQKRKKQISKKTHEDIRMVSFRQPFAHLISKGCKKIENRYKKIPKKYIGGWHALQVSKKWNNLITSEAYAAVDSPKYQAFIGEYEIKDVDVLADYDDTNSDDAADKALVLTLQKRKEMVNAMKEECGHIIGFFKVDDEAVSRDEAYKTDRWFTDYPVKTTVYWHITDVIRLEKADWYEVAGNLGWVGLKEKDKKKVNKLFDKYIK